MKVHLRLLAVAVAMLVVWSSSLALAADPPAKGVIAIVGAAHTHMKWYPMNLNGNKNIRVKYVWDPDAKRAEWCAKNLRGAKVAASVDEVLSDPEVTGVMIMSETNRHHDLVLAAAKAHKAMFVEKPLAITGKDAAEMADAIDKAGVFFTTGYFMRTSPKYQFIKEQIEKGAFGKITRAYAANCHNAGREGEFDNSFHHWFTEENQAGGGAFIDMGTHAVDLLMWLLGDVESATGDLSAVATKYGGNDDCGEALLKFKSGATGVAAAAWVCPFNTLRLEIVGTEGYAVYLEDGSRDQLFFQSRKVPGSDLSKPVPDDKMPKGLPSPVDQFLNAMTGQKGPGAIPAQEAAARVSVMEAIYSGAKKHQWVKPPVAPGKGYEPPAGMKEITVPESY
jgi:predicted dehydrogenase